MNQNENTVYIDKINEVWIKVYSADDGILMGLYEHFTFEVIGHKYTAAYKMGTWDGKIHLYQLRTKRIYFGLLNKVINFCHSQNYVISLNGFPPSTKSISLESIKEFMDSFLISSSSSSSSSSSNKETKPLEIRDYQLSSLHHCINNKRGLILSPTSSGKSLIIYCLVKWYQQIFNINDIVNKKILIIVPTLGLIEQMSHDFINYDSENIMKSCIHKIHSGQEKYDLDKQIIISTWQSLIKENSNWYKSFGLVIVDECHGAKSASIKGIMEKCVDIVYKFGFTGTLDNHKTHHWVLEGLFGEVKKVISTAELIERNQISNLRIKCLLLTYPEVDIKAASHLTYMEEIDFIINHQKRNKIILNLIASLNQQNTLLLFNRIETQGKPLYEACKVLFGAERHILYIAGEIKAKEREEIRLFTEINNNVIIIASIGTMSTGISITNLHNIVFLTPSKSKIRTLQSIGRVLRKNDNKIIATLYDIVDNLSYKKHKNFTLLHFIERLKYYDEEQFNYKIHQINLSTTPS